MRRPGQWEAFEYDEASPDRFQHREIDTNQAYRYLQEGGYQIAKDDKEFIDALKTASTAARTKRRAAMPTEAVLRRANPEGTMYEALEYEKANPTRATRTHVKPEDLARWREDGGFDEVDDEAWAEHNRRANGVEEYVHVAEVRPEAAGVLAEESRTVSRRPAEESAMEWHLGQAQQEDADARRGRIFGQAAADFTKNLTGVDYNPATYAKDDSQSAVRRFVAKREEAKRAALEDPTSPESQRFQRAVEKAMPGIYTPEELANIAAADEAYITDYVKVRAAAKNRADSDAAANQRASARQEFEATQGNLNRQAQITAAGISAAERKDLASMTQGTQLAIAGMNREEQRLNRESHEKIAALNAGNKTDAAQGKSNIPGLEIEEGASPSSDDAKRVKTAMVAANTMGGYINELRNLYRNQGPSMMGPTAEKQRQLITAIQLEAKTVAELGALSGPDLGLMQSVAGADPTTFQGFLKSSFGLSDPNAALDQLDKWMHVKVNALKKTYGYRDARKDPARTAPPASLDEPVPTPKEQKALEWLRSNPGDTSPSAEKLRAALRERGFGL